MTKELQEGDKAPNFELLTDGGGVAKLSDFSEGWLILYFYPKDDTSGCTKQAIAFTAQNPKFEKLGATILGVSKDSVKKHDHFKAKHNLGITLASDEETKTIQAYGCWKEKNMYGRKYMGVERSTFVIDQQAVIRKIWRKVKITNHVDDVYDFLTKNASE